MEHMSRGDRVTFEFVERITLEERSSDITVIRDVEVTPEIEMVAENTSYRIRGALVFTGEYEARKQGEATHPLLLDRSANYNKRLIRNIHHRIPVDISLPADRIDEDGVVMEIIALDYDLKDPNQLTVITEVELQGVYNDTVVKNSHWDQATKFDYDQPLQEEPLASTPQQWQSPLATSPEYEVELPPLQLPPLQATELAVEPEVQPTSTSVEGNTGEQGKEAVVEVFEDVPRPELQVDAETGYVGTYPEKREEKVEKVEQAEQAEQAELGAPSADIRPTEDGATLDSSVERPEEDDVGDEEAGMAIVEDDWAHDELLIDREPEVKVTIVQKEHRHEPLQKEVSIDRQKEVVNEERPASTAHLLAKFLQNKEETMTQIHLCFVQPGETLTDIARRYDTREEDILAFNSLSGVATIGGKVLKIPVRHNR